MPSHVLLTVICCTILVTSAVIEGHVYDDEAIARGDDYIDRLLKETFEDKVSEYDPYRIDDSVVGFHRKIAFVNISGEAKLHDGFILGLKTLHRPNHCSLEEETSRLNVKADLGAGVLDFNYSGSVKFMNIGPTITVHGKLGYIGVHIEFDVDSETGKNGRLNKFVIDDMRGMQVWITGLGPLNWAVNPIVTGVTMIFKRFLRNFLEDKVEKHIAERIPNFQFPVEAEDQSQTVTQPISEESLTDAESLVEIDEIILPNEDVESAELQKAIEPERIEIPDELELYLEENVKTSESPESGRIDSETDICEQGDGSLYVDEEDTLSSEESLESYLKSKM